MASTSPVLPGVLNQGPYASLRNLCQESLGTSCWVWGGGRAKAHPNPAEALIIIEAFILTCQLPAQWNPKLPALHQKWEQDFSTHQTIQQKASC